MPPITRRSLLAAGLGGALLPAVGYARPEGPRFVSLDHGLAQTLIEIDAALVGLPQTQYWETWTIEPPLPASTANLGTSREINMEVLARLRPDLIVSTPYLEGVRDRMERMAPVESFPIHALGKSPYADIVAATRRLGVLADREQAADQLIRRTEKTLSGMRAAVAPLRDAPLVMLNFIDTRHVRIYGENCLFQDVLDRLNLRNGWSRWTNAWGFATVGIESLADIGDSRVFVLDPVPSDVFPVLSGSPLWQNLPFVKAGRLIRFPTVLMFGTLPSVARLARLLGEFGARHG